jgi:hypothetical protein
MRSSSSDYLVKGEVRRGAVTERWSRRTTVSNHDWLWLGLYKLVSQPRDGIGSRTDTLEAARTRAFDVLIHNRLSFHLEHSGGLHKCPLP